MANSIDEWVSISPDLYRNKATGHVMGPPSKVILRVNKFETYVDACGCVEARTIPGEPEHAWYIAATNLPQVDATIIDLDGRALKLLAIEYHYGVGEIHLICQSKG